MKHHLQPLLNPRSVTIVGASAQTDSVGEWSLKNLLKGGYKGNIYPVNPRYKELQGIRCYESLSDLPEVPELVIFSVGDHRVEDLLEQAISLGIPAAVLISPLMLDKDKAPYLQERIKKKIFDSGMLVCGANGMGFYNIRDNVWACGFESNRHKTPGKISLISHSGSGMSGILDCEERFRCNFAVSTGNELSVTMDQYLDYVLDLPETRAVGLFIETARNPIGFIKALEKAKKKRIPIVAIKVGRTEFSAKLAVSHSGAMAGNDATYDAIFDYYGVQRVRDMDELATTLILFAELQPVSQGSLVTMHDSGGERQLLIDLADEINVPLATLDKKTITSLESVLDPELPAVNPLDAWSRGGEDSDHRMARCFSILMKDPNVAIGAFVVVRGPESKIYLSYIDYLKKAHSESEKPVLLVCARQGSGFDIKAITATHSGFPVVDGLSTFLTGIKALFSYRDFLERKTFLSERIDQSKVDHWKKKLARKDIISESQALNLLADFGIPIARNQLASTWETALKAAKDIGFPVVLKTTASGILHKSVVDGVILNISGEEELQESYDDMNSCLGSDVLVAEMVKKGVEMLLGVYQDLQFGPIVVMGLGGIHTEVIKDVCFLLPPFDQSHAFSSLKKLRFYAMLENSHDISSKNILKFCSIASIFSCMIDQLRDDILELDVNPLVLNKDGCVAVDSLLVGVGQEKNLTNKDRSTN